MSDESYSPLYLAGIEHFNVCDFYESHEVWEELWADYQGPSRKFYQGLIQAAVALHHFGNGNVRGAFKLFHSSRDYMAPYGPVYLGLDSTGFWTQMQRCFSEVLNPPNPDHRPVLDEDQVPVITLDPPPEQWPDPEELLRHAD